MIFDNRQIILCHEIQVEKRQVLGVCVFDGDKFWKDIGYHVFELVSGFKDHETLETFEKDSIGTIFHVIRYFGADIVVRNNQDFNQVFIKSAGVSFEYP